MFLHRVDVDIEADVYSERPVIDFWDFRWKANSGAVSSRPTRIFRSSMRVLLGERDVELINFITELQGVSERRKAMHNTRSDPTLDSLVIHDTRSDPYFRDETFF